MAEWEPEYPKGRTHFAHRAIRVMTKRVVAQEYGQAVFSLLTVIAMQEDSKRYSGPVTYWNENLAALAGFANSKAMDRARTRAVESGWLVYLPGTNRKPGRYWVQIPERHNDAPDGPCDDSDDDMNQSQQSKSTNEVGNEVGTEPGMKWEANRERSGKRSGKRSGNLSYLPLSPVLDPPKSPQGGSRGLSTRGKDKAPDLSDTQAIVTWHEQHVGQHGLNGSESETLNLVALAEYAVEKGNDPPRIFFWGLANWKTAMGRITQAHEEQARKRLLALRRENTTVQPGVLAAIDQVAAGMRLPKVDGGAA